jgi:hypothetical protein
MARITPNDGETVWIEYPEGKHFESVYDTKTDTFTPAGGQAIPANAVANWSRQQHENTDIGDDPKEAAAGRLTRS